MVASISPSMRRVCATAIQRRDTTPATVNKCAREGVGPKVVSILLHRSCNLSLWLAYCKPSLAALVGKQRGEITQMARKRASEPNDVAAASPLRRRWSALPFAGWMLRRKPPLPSQIAPPANSEPTDSVARLSNDPPTPAPEPATQVEPTTAGQLVRGVEESPVASESSIGSKG